MIPRPSRDHVLLLVAVVALGLGVWVFISPDRLPFLIDAVYDVAVDTSPTTIAAFVTALLLVIAGSRVLNGITGELNRSPIVDQAPETPVETPVPEATAVLDSTYRNIDSWFVDAGEQERRVAMYGRRAGHHDELPDQVEQLFDELGVTARDTYATAVSCDLETAERAVETGTWTNDRVAAAFLAQDLDASPTFTTWERIAAWLAPQRTFEARINRTVDAIEETGNAYLTYGNVPSEDGRESVVGGTGGDS